MPEAKAIRRKDIFLKRFFSSRIRNDTYSELKKDIAVPSCNNDVSSDRPVINTYKSINDTPNTQTATR